MAEPDYNAPWVVGHNKHHFTWLVPKKKKNSWAQHKDKIQLKFGNPGSLLSTGNFIELAEQKLFTQMGRGEVKKQT